MSKVVVIGAGLSGLAAAFRIRQANPRAEVVVLEERARAGGHIVTERQDGYLIEHGPNGIFDAKPHTLRLCRDLGLGEQLIVASEASRKNRYLFVNEQLHRLPGDPLGLLRTPLLSWQGKLAMLAEPFRRRHGNLPMDESVAQFARRRFGCEAADVFIDALVTGIHAGDPEKLSVAAAFPRLPMFERTAGSVIRGVMRAGKVKRREAIARGETPMPQRMWSFRDGLQVMINSLVSKLGTDLHLGVGVRRIEKSSSGWLVHGEGGDSWNADAVVNTAPAFRQAEQLATIDEPMAQEIASIAYNRIAVVVLGYRSEHAPQPEGFGYIAPQLTRRDVLGVQWCSAIYPERAPPGFVLWRALCAGVNRADMADLPDNELLRRVHAEMTIAMGVTAPPAFHRIVRWPRAIPQYNVGHLARVARIESMASKHPGLTLGGNAYHGVAMNDCCEQAERIAIAITPV